MRSDQYAEYNAYLKQKSKLGDVYRQFYLFPRLTRYLKGRALDIGCGTGEFAQYRANTAACDINPLNVAELVERGIEAKLIENNRLPFSDASFDSAIMDNVLEHIAVPDDLLREVNRILKVGGYLLVGVPGERGFASEGDHKVFYNEENLVPLMQRLGFTVDKLFWTPFRSRYLDKKMKQYCLFARFVKQAYSRGEAPI